MIDAAGPRNRRSDAEGSRERLATPGEVANLAVTSREPIRAGRPRRMLLVSPDFPPHMIGGGAMVSLQLAREYRELGWEVTVLSMDTSRAGVWSRPVESIVDGTRVIFLPLLARFEMPGFSLVFVAPASLPGAVRMVRTFRQETWDAVHLHGNPVFLVDAVGLLCRLRPTPFVLTFHGIMQDTSRLGWFRGVLLRLLFNIERRIFARATALTAVSATTLDDVRAEGFRAARMVTIPVSNFPEASSPSEQGQRLSPQLGGLGLKPGSFVLCLGAFIPRKGQDLLLRSFVELARGQDLPESLQLVFAGFERDRQYLAELRRAASDAGLGSRVHFVGAVTDLEKRELLRLARWVVMPSRYEASPGLAFEALAAGCVLVAPDLPCFLEVIGDARNAAVFRTGDAASLTRVLAQLLRDPTSEEEIRVGAVHRSRQFDTWGQIARKYLELFDSSTTIIGMSS